MRLDRVAGRPGVAAVACTAAPATLATSALPARRAASIPVLEAAKAE
ncbi:hypothetical protein ACFHW2_29855 [Actinomadura sp. LOL_016]